jgi:N-methylhydantoinase A
VPTVAAVVSDLADAHVEASTRRQVFFRGGWQSTPIYDRDALRAGSLVAGPAVIEATDTTILVNPGHTALMDSSGNLVMDVSTTKAAGAN